jgi:hypothetical protein
VHANRGVLAEVIRVPSGGAKAINAAALGNILRRLALLERLALRDKCNEHQRSSNYKTHSKSRRISNETTRDGVKKAGAAVAAAGAAHVQPPCAGDGRGTLNCFPVEKIVDFEVEAPNANFISNYSTVKVFVHPKRRL